MWERLRAYLIWQGVLLAWTFATIVACELAAPRERHSSRSRLKGGMLWMIYIVASGTTLCGFRGLADWLGLRPLVSLDLTPSAGLASWLRWLLLPFALLAAALFTDFLYYWCHRAQHRWFWRFHVVHHSYRELNALNSPNHWTEELIRLPFMTLPAALALNLHAVGTTLSAAVMTLQLYFIHAPVRVGLGPLRRLLNDPAMHRIHHSLEPRHFDKNFGGFSTVWDQVFGTAYFPEKNEWPATGVGDSPEVEGLRDYLLRPFNGVGRQ